jgi:hypothetical protein
MAASHQWWLSRQTSPATGSWFRLAELLFLVHLDPGTGAAHELPRDCGFHWDGEWLWVLRVGVMWVAESTHDKTVNGSSYYRTKPLRLVPQGPIGLTVPNARTGVADVEVFKINLQSAVCCPLIRACLGERAMTDSTG